MLIPLMGNTAKADRSQSQCLSRTEAGIRAVDRSYNRIKEEGVNAKRILAVGLVVALLFPLLPQVVFADEETPEVVSGGQRRRYLRSG